MGKKIVWLYPKLEKWMGGTKYVFECSKKLSKNYDLIVICQKGTELVLNEFKKENIVVVNLTSYSFTDPIFWVAPKLFIKRDVKKIKKIIGEEAIIISSMFPMNIIASKFTNKHVQIIYEPFAFFFDDEFITSFGKNKVIFFKIMKYFYSHIDIVATKSSNSILALSNYEKNRIRKIYGVEAAVIYEGIDIDFFKPRDTSYLSQKYSDVFPIMHSTGFDTFKGTDLVINSLPLLKECIPNFKLFITYTRENKKKLYYYKNFIKKNKLDLNVEFLGLLPYNKLPEYYSFSKFYLEPGKNRSMSLSNKEALACGIPVIRGNDSSEEVIDGFNGFLVNPKSVDELVGKIMIYFQDKQKYEYIKGNTRKSITDKFTWEKVVGKIINSIEE
jgi:glycosyltransferase involved in cell wall biosynthesis